MDILEYLDELPKKDGDGQEWLVEHEQISGLLQDILPDTEPSEQPSDVEILIAMIRENLGPILQSSLDPVELAVVQMTFGLEGRQPASFRQMAAALNLADKAEARAVLQRALGKLRATFQQMYLEPHGLADDLLDTESV